MKKIVLFSRSVYPKKGGSAFVTENLVSNFKEDEMAVIGGKAIGASTIQRKSGPKFYYLTTQINIKGRADRFFEWLRWFLFPFALMRARKLSKQENASAILGTFPDGFFLLLACLTAKRLGLPFYSYFHNTYRENRRGLSRLIANRIQEMAFNESRHIYLMSEGMANYYRQQYPGFASKFKTLVHTFKEYPSVKDQPLHLGKQEWNLAFIGNFNESNAEATGRVVNALKQDPRFKLNFYTPVPKLLLKTRGIDVDAIDYKGYLPDAVFYEKLSENDLLVLTHGFTGGYSRNEYETIFPTRTIPFLLLKKPIILHSPPFAFLTSFFNTRQAALVLDNADEQSVLKGVQGFIADSDRMDRVAVNARQAAEEFYGPNVISMLKREMALHE